MLFFCLEVPLLLPESKKVNAGEKKEGKKLSPPPTFFSNNLMASKYKEEEEEERQGNLKDEEKGEDEETLFIFPLCLSQRPITFSPSYEDQRHATTKLPCSTGCCLPNLLALLLLRAEHTQSHFLQTLIERGKISRARTVGQRSTCPQLAQLQFPWEVGTKQTLKAFCCALYLSMSFNCLRQLNLH